MPDGVPKNLKNTVHPFNYGDFEKLKKICKKYKIAAIKMEVARNSLPNRDFLKDSFLEESNESIERNTFQPVFIPQNKLAMKQLIDFKSSREHMALIVDEYGEIQGLITLEDIIEEIIGEIFDETDTDETYLEKIDSNNYLFNGNASVREINRSLDINLPDQFVTLSGLIHDLAKEIPKVGKVFFIEDVKLQIISRSINKINKVKLSI